MQQLIFLQDLWVRSKPWNNMCYPYNRNKWNPPHIHSKAVSLTAWPCKWRHYLWNVRNCLPNNTAEQSRRLASSATQLQKPLISQEMDTSPCRPNCRLIINITVSSAQAPCHKDMLESEGKAHHISSPCTSLSQILLFSSNWAVFVP